MTFSMSPVHRLGRNIFVSFLNRSASTWIWQRNAPGSWGLSAWRQLAQELLEALEFLHNEAKLIHCGTYLSQFWVYTRTDPSVRSVDLRKGNLLMRTKTDVLFQELEKRELTMPSVRKEVGEGHIVYSTPDVIIPDDLDRSVLCDFGEARSGDADEPLYALIQPQEYRSPEAILSMPISYASDIWNAGLLLWHMFEGMAIFNPQYEDKGHSYQWQLFQLAFILGHPPSFLKQTSRNPNMVRQFFNEGGTFKSPARQKFDLEDQVKKLPKGSEGKEFARFIGRFLRWDPKERATARELRADPFLQDS